jgi:hypothetical protein
MIKPAATLRRLVQRVPVWSFFLAGFLVIAAGMFFLGRATQANSYQARYDQQHRLLVQRQNSLVAQQASLNRRSARLTNRRGSLTAGEATLSQQQAKVAQQQAAVNAAQAAVVQQQTSLTQQQAALNAAKTVLAQQQAALAASQSTFSQQQAQLAQQEAALQQQLSGVKATQFGNGLFLVGHDIQAGQYHTQGAAAGGQCSWALLRSDNPADIAEQNTSQGPQTVTLTTPYFTSNGCGTWTKIT